jgi:hypothetical protein
LPPDWPPTAEKHGRSAIKTIRLLTIGNSFADNALRHLESIAGSTAGVRIKVGRANIGGCSLEKHSNLARYTEAHPELKPYCLSTSPTGVRRLVTLQEALRAEPWDFVTLQQVSSHSWLRNSFEPHLGRLHKLVRKLAPRAKIWLHQTWAYRSDAPFLPEHAITQELMHTRIVATYRHYAAKYGCRVLPSGDAVQLARRTAGRTFTWPDPGYDYQHAKAPALPRQEHSLESGWHWQIVNTPNGVPALCLDAKHLNDRGCYLIGAVWFECLTGLDLHDAPFAPKGIEKATLAFLRDAAHQAMQEHRRA